MGDVARIVVHRDLGPGFTHCDSEDCGCAPYVTEIDADDPRSFEDIWAEVERHQQTN
jgi:hypothetical protein